VYRYATTRHFELLNDDDPDLEGSNMLETTVIKETEGPQLFTLLHADGTPSAIPVIPHPDGFTLHISMGHGKVLHDLMTNRNGE